MNEHNTSTRPTRDGVESRCSCGWTQLYADAQTAALACGRHAAQKASGRE